MADRTINTEADYNDDQGYIHSAGDTISFAKGQTYTKRFKLIDDGSSTAVNPIIVTSHGTGADPLFREFGQVPSSWTDTGGNLWTWTNPAALPGKLVLINEFIICSRVTGSPAAEFEYNYNDTTEVLTLYSPSDPSTEYNEVYFCDTGDWAFKLKSSHTNVIANFKAEKANCMFLVTDENANARNNITINTFESDYCFNGIAIESAAGGATLDVVNIFGGTARNSSGAGIRATTPTVSNVTIKNVIVDGSGEGESSAGIYYIDVTGGYVNNCRVSNAYYGNYFTDGSAYYTDSGATGIIFESNKAANIGGPIYQDNSGAAGNIFKGNEGINVSTDLASADNGAFKVSDSDNNDAATTIIANNTCTITTTGVNQYALRVSRLIGIGATLEYKNNIITGASHAFIYQVIALVDHAKLDEDYNTFEGINLLTPSVPVSTVNTAWDTLGSNDIDTDPGLDSNYIPGVNAGSIGTGVKWWIGTSPTGANGEPFSDFDTDRGGNGSTLGPFHTKNL